MRFPLIVMVLFVHSLGFENISTTDWSHSSWNIFHIISETISHNFCLLSVGCFFFFSGFLFYSTPRGFADKIKRRVKSLLLPYLCWNTLIIIAHLIVYYALSLFFTVHDDGMQIVQKGPLYWYVVGPADFPLLYIRNLFVASLVSPILYQLFNRIPPSKVLKNTSVLICIVIKVTFRSVLLGCKKKKLII